MSSYKNINKNFEKREKQSIIDKQSSHDWYIDYMFTRTNNMFLYSGQPDSIDIDRMEQHMQNTGVVGITDFFDSKVTEQFGTFGAKGYNLHYRPKEMTVSNPWVEQSKQSKNLIVGTECVYILNDSYQLGLRDLISRYAIQLVENDITLNMANTLLRAQALISASDSNDVSSAQKFIDDLILGKYTAVADNTFLDGIKSSPLFSQGGSNTLTQIIELQQYLKASLYNELGLQSNYNMKRESINEAESGLNEDMLKPLIYDMLKQRKRGVAWINELYGKKYNFKMQVRLNEIWRIDEPEDILNKKLKEVRQ